ncbi:hypothetical protein SLS57_006744 [Botryosphaeria dothidea]
MVNWTADVDAKLFVCVLKQMSGSLNYGQLASDMAAMGIDCTGKACSHRIANLKNKAKSAGGGSSASAPATPRKRSAPSSTVTPKTSSIGKKRGVESFVAASKRMKRELDPDSDTVSDDSEHGGPDEEWGATKKKAVGGAGGGHKMLKTLGGSFKDDSGDGDDEGDGGDAQAAADLHLFTAAAAAMEVEDQVEEV